MASPFFLHTAEPLSRFAGVWQETDDSYRASTQVVFERIMRGSSRPPPGDEYNAMMRRVLGFPGFLIMSFNGQNGFSLKRGQGEALLVKINTGTELVGREMITSYLNSDPLLSLHMQNWPPCGHDSIIEFRVQGDELKETTTRTLRPADTETVKVNRVYRRVVSDLEHATTRLRGKWVLAVAQHGSSTEAERALLEFIGMPADVAQRRLADEVNDIGSKWIVPAGPDEILFASTTSVDVVLDMPVCAKLMPDSAEARLRAPELGAVALSRGGTHLCLISHPSSGIAMHDQWELISPIEIRWTRTAFRGAEQSPVVIRTLVKWDNKTSMPKARHSLPVKSSEEGLAVPLRVGIFWDLENVPIPRGEDAGVLASHLRRICLPPSAVLVAFEAYFNTRVVTDGVAVQLGNAGVKMIHVAAPDKNGADLRIVQAANDFVVTHGTGAVLVVVVSSDVNFLPLGQSLRRQAPRVASMLVHGPNVNPALLSVFSIVHEWLSIAERRSPSRSPPSQTANVTKIKCKDCHAKFESKSALLQHARAKGHEA